MTTGRINQVASLFIEKVRTESNPESGYAPLKGARTPLRRRDPRFYDHVDREDESSLSVAVLHSLRPPGLSAGGFALVGIERDLRRTHGQETLSFDHDSAPRRNDTECRASGRDAVGVFDRGTVGPCFRTSRPFE